MKKEISTLARLVLLLRRDEHRAIKVQAAQEGISMSLWVYRLIQKEFERLKKG